MRLYTIFLLLSSALFCSGAKIDDLRKAAEQGLAMAQYNLGTKYATAHGVAKSYVEVVNGKYEYIALSPSGKLSPIFSSHDKCAAYTRKHSKKFGDGTVIHRRLKK
jgi:hypothetical protein